MCFIGFGLRFKFGIKLLLALKFTCFFPFLVAPQKEKEKSFYNNLNLFNVYNTAQKIKFSETGGENDWDCGVGHIY